MSEGDDSHLSSGSFIHAHGRRPSAHSPLSSFIDNLSKSDLSQRQVPRAIIGPQSRAFPHAYIDLCRSRFTCRDKGLAKKQCDSAADTRMTLWPLREEVVDPIGLAAASMAHASHMVSLYLWHTTTLLEPRLLTSTEMDPESNVRYVVAGNPTGWAGIAKTIRDVDEDTIEDYKEDIDTLLVFTGLFSAVLTAFVVESYQQLSPDPMAPVVKLLEHIAGQTQNYTITSNTINSTFSPTAEIEAAFEPPLSAVRVNQLWFASLAITLITASFAMLVKQWLREYLAMAYTSPHDRIRARQYRHPSLQAWKVLEIAGILPLLLQVALGLFFLGLCFFTFSVNAGVGKGSTVLVSTWIFLFVSVTLAPVASPRCPYKTAILQNLMVKVRRWMSGLLYSASVHAAMRTVFEILRSIGLSSNSPCQSLPPRGQHWVEESEALQQDVNELDILKEVDAFLLDDDLLGTTIFDSLTQYHPTPSTIIEFVLQALNLRLKGVLITQPLNSTPDLRRLTKRGWMAVSDIVANTILNNIGKQGSEIGGWYEDAIHILFAGSDHPLTPTASKALVHSIHKSTISSFTAVLASLTPMPDILIRRFHDVLGPLEDQLIGMIDDTVTTATSPQASDITNLALQLLTLEGLDVQDYRLFRSIISRLQSLPAHTWVWGMDLIAKAVVRRLDAAGHAPLGTWLEEAFRLFLFPFNQSVTSTASTALVSLLRKSTIAHFVKLLDSLASQSQLVMPRLRDLLPPLSHHSAELIHKGDALPSDIIRFVFRLYMLEVNDAQTTLPLRCIVDLQSLPEQTWIVGSDLLGMLLRQINTDAASVGGGAETWFEDAHYLLLSAPNRPLTATTREALVCSIQKSTISRFTNLLGSLIPVSESTPVAPVLRDLTGSAELSAHITRLIRRSELPPEDVIPLVCRLYELDGGRLLLARPYPRVIDLQTLSPPVWTSGSHIIGETILQSLDKEKNANGIGSWLEDAVATLLATPPCPLHATAINALAALCKENAQRERFDQCIRIAASPASSQYPHVIAIFRDVCKQLSTDDDMCRLLWTLLWSIPCSSKCTHPRPSYMGPLFHDHIQDHEDWAGHYVPLLVDRIIGLVTVQGLWPPAVDISLRALMSCPVPLHQLHADAPGILWDILATFSTSGNALHNLVGADEKWHSSVKMDVAIENVVSLFADVDNEGTRNVHLDGGMLELIIINA
ncbi:hypothetical protein NM688_g7229 [Phlebia brevispora]|uniref:Uncharacterized protein n=1 Tax=Phlebia brevispora TaxID=194682 RepID=A0ACC1S7P7_9APHY|nr:hypothetical protein NM688_g7229 [Phlebia brevispora]